MEPNKRELNWKFLIEKEEKILPQILFIGFPLVGLLHLYKLPSPLQKIINLILPGD